MKKLILLTALAGLLDLQASAQAEAYTSALDSLFRAFKERQYALMKPILDPNAKIANLPKGLNDITMPQVLAQLPTPVSYTVSNAQAKGKEMHIAVEFSFADGTREPQHYTFNAARRVVAMDLMGSK